MKKQYEQPVLAMCELQEDTAIMAAPSISDHGYGWDDDGPVSAIESL